MKRKEFDLGPGIQVENLVNGASFLSMHRQDGKLRRFATGNVYDGYCIAGLDPFRPRFLKVLYKGHSSGGPDEYIPLGLDGAYLGLPEDVRKLLAEATDRNRLKLERAGFKPDPPGAFVKLENAERPHTDCFALMLGSYSEIRLETCLWKEWIYQRLFDGPLGDDGISMLGNAYLGFLTWGDGRVSHYAPGDETQGRLIDPAGDFKRAIKKTAHDVYAALTKYEGW